MRHHRNPERLFACVLRVLLFGMAVACGDDRSRPDRSLDPRWHDLYREALIRREQVRAVVLNHLGHWNAVRKYQNLFKMFGVEDRIPMAPRTDEVIRGLEAAARAAGLRQVQVEAHMASTGPPSLPETVETPGGYAFKPDEVAGTLAFVVRGRPADLSLAERLVMSLRDSPSRLLLPAAVRLHRGEMVVEGSAFFFFDIRPPVQVLRAPDLARDLEEAGLPTGAPDAATAEMILTLTRLYGETAVDAALSGPSLYEAARARLLNARFEFFKARAQEVEALRFSRLLER